MDVQRMTLDERLTAAAVILRDAIEAVDARDAAERARCEADGDVGGA